MRRRRVYFRASDSELPQRPSYRWRLIMSHCHPGRGRDAHIQHRSMFLFRAAHQLLA
jgi:hypothetical protein